MEPSSEENRSPDSSARSGGRVALASIVRLVIVLAITWVAVVAVARLMGRTDPMLPAAVAALLCGVGGVGAAIVGRQPVGRIETHWLHLAIGIRTGTPLLGLLLVHGIDRSLIDAGLPFYLLPFYAVTLVVETLASIRELKRMAPAGKADVKSGAVSRAT